MLLSTRSINGESIVNPPHHPRLMLRRKMEGRDCWQHMGLCFEEGQALHSKKISEREDPKELEAGS